MCETEETIRNSNVDFIVMGEGEITTAELVNALENGKRLNKVTGIWYKENNIIIKNEPRPLIKDLDELPFQHGT